MMEFSLSDLFCLGHFFQTSNPLGKWNKVPKSNVLICVEAKCMGWVQETMLQYQQLIIFTVGLL